MHTHSATGTNPNANLHPQPHPHAHSMHISRFFGSTNREAMRQVRMALGSEALIVSNRRVNGGVEILAADATKVADDDSPAGVVVGMPGGATFMALPPQPRPVPGPAVTMTQHPAALMDAIADLRGELAHRIENLAWQQACQQQNAKAPQALALFQTLLALGFSTALLRAVLKHLPAGLNETAALAWARGELMAKVPVCADENALWRPGLALALVGPTGVGKTTTVAKLAARAVRRFGPRGVALLTTDTYRIGACEQLKIYGQILRAPVHVAHDATELRRIVGTLPADCVLLIDNVGMSQRDSKVGEQAAMLRAAGRDVARLLVLNAASGGDTLEDVARTYVNDGGAPLAGCIVTKLDESARLAPALDTAVRHQLPIHYVSTGQKVPEDLSRPSAQDLINQAFVGVSPGASSGVATGRTQTLYAPNRADLAALMTSETQAAAREETRFLSSLLALAHPGRPALDPDLARAACAEIDAHGVCRQAFAQWQARGTDHPSDADALKQTTQTLLNDVRQQALHVMSPVCHVVLHERAAVTKAREGKGTLRWAQVAALAGDGSLHPGVSPVQSLQYAQTWLSSCGASALGAADDTRIRVHGAQCLARQLPEAPALHVFDGGAITLYRQLHAQGLAWMAVCAPGVAVVHDDALTRSGTLARRAAYRLLDPAFWQHGLQTCVNKPVAQWSAWFAADAVAVRQRGHADLALRLVHVRLLDRRDGSIAYQGSALCHAPLDDADIARLLLVRLAQKPLARTVQAFWRLLGHMSACAGVGIAAVRDAHAALTAYQASGALDDHNWQAHAALAVHLGLAAWCIQQSDQTAAARQALAVLCAQAKPSVNAQAAGLLRLFAVREMLGAAGQTAGA